MRLILFLFIFSLFIVNSFGQQSTIVKKNVSDTILNEKRTLNIPSDSFHSMKVMQKLFPGKLYDLSSKDYQDFFISWECKKCRPAVNIEREFPYTDGVITRLRKTINYKDSKGNEFKILVFNHSSFFENEEDKRHGIKGILGLAKFAKINGNWQIRSFQPAVGEFGSYGQCPAPDLIVIGGDQYALTLNNKFKLNGGPTISSLILIAGNNGKYSRILTVDMYEQLKSINCCDRVTWESTIKVDQNSKKQYYRDVIVTTKGKYNRPGPNEDDSVPNEIESFTKNKKSFRFVIEKRYIFNGKQYVLKGKPIVTILH